MGIFSKMSEGIKKSVRSWLNITPAGSYVIQINELLDFELNAIRNRIWYRGDSNEIEQMYQQNPDYADRFKFWASRSSQGIEMRKIHTGLPALIVKVLASIVIADMNDIEIENGKQQNIWNEIEKENRIKKILKKAIRETLFIGDGAFKITIDTEISEYPIVEWYSGEKIEIVKSRNRLKEVIFKTEYRSHGKRYTLHEHYGYGYIKNHLYHDEKEVLLNTISQTENVSDYIFDKSIILATPLQIYDSSKYEGRGGSIYDGKLDAFDAFDEIFSQWMDAVRKGRATRYIPTDLIPRNPKDGSLQRPNPFDNSFIEIRGSLSEKEGNRIDVNQPTIPHESYLSSYITALDLCLQGIISPSTLGIDTKKLDNAEAQREKEKTTLYTRNAIVETLQETLPHLVSAAVNAYCILNNSQVEEIKSNISFGEYANPSFESQVETVGKGKQQGIMSIEASVEELYGDTKTNDWKKEEVARLKTEQGILEMEEPSINQEVGEFSIEIDEDNENNKNEEEDGGKEQENESEGVKQSIQNEQGGI